MEYVKAQLATGWKTPDQIINEASKQRDRFKNEGIRQHYQTQIDAAIAAKYEVVQ